MTDEEKMTLRKMKARATVMDIEMKRRRHPPTLKVTGCPENEYNGTYSQHGETVNGAPVYESLHKDRSNTGVFLIYKAKNRRRKEKNRPRERIEMKNATFTGRQRNETKCGYRVV